MGEGVIDSVGETRNEVGLFDLVMKCLLGTRKNNLGFCFGVVLIKNENSGR